MLNHSAQTFDNNKLREIKSQCLIQPVQGTARAKPKRSEDVDRLKFNTMVNAALQLCNTIRFARDHTSKNINVKDIKALLKVLEEGAINNINIIDIETDSVKIIQGLSKILKDRNNVTSLSIVTNENFKSNNKGLVITSSLASKAQSLIEILKSNTSLTSLNVELLIHGIIPKERPIILDNIEEAVIIFLENKRKQLEVALKEESTKGKKSLTIIENLGLRFFGLALSGNLKDPFRLFDALSYQPLLRELTLNGGVIGPNEVELLTEYIKERKLKIESLELSYNQLNSESIYKLFTALPTCEYLNNLTLIQYSLIDGKAADCIIDFLKNRYTPLRIDMSVSIFPKDKCEIYKEVVENNTFLSAPNVPFSYRLSGRYLLAYEKLTSPYYLNESILSLRELSFLKHNFINFINEIARFPSRDQPFKDKNFINKAFEITEFIQNYLLPDRQRIGPGYLGSIIILRDLNSIKRWFKEVDSDLEKACENKDPALARPCLEALKRWYVDLFNELDEGIATKGYVLSDQDLITIKERINTLFNQWDEMFKKTGSILDILQTIPLFNEAVEIYAKNYCFLSWLSFEEARDNLQYIYVEGYKLRDIPKDVEEKKIEEFKAECLELLREIDNIHKILLRIDEYLENHFFRIAGVCKALPGEQKDYKSLPNAQDNRIYLPREVWHHIWSYLNIGDINISNIGMGKPLQDEERILITNKQLEEENASLRLENTELKQEIINLKNKNEELEKLLRQASFALNGKRPSSELTSSSTSTIEASSPMHDTMAVELNDEQIKNRMSITNVLSDAPTSPPSNKRRRIEQEEDMSHNPGNTAGCQRL